MNGRRLEPEGFSGRSWFFIVDQRLVHVRMAWSGYEGEPFVDRLVLGELRSDALADVAVLDVPITFPSFESPEW
jgi:hypothetical protein